MAAPDDSPASFDATRIRRPDPVLLRYYVVIALLTGPAFPFVLVPLWIKYNTLEYEIDGEGVRMAWGFLFRKEILLTYRRIQDIHVRRNIVHRWFGLAAVALQTASGSAGAEMTIEGVLEPEKLRDFLYEKMRGARGLDRQAEAEPDADRPDDEALALLHEIRDLLRARTAPEATL